MSRQLKFRVWDKANNEWLAASDQNSLTYYGFHLFGEVMMMQKVDVESLADLVIEQCTGRMDSKKTEIYEGDILQIRKRLIDQEDNQHKIFKFFGVVEYDETLASYNLRYDHGGTGDVRGIEGLPYWAGSGPVLGNIHENPELLEVK